VLQVIMGLEKRISSVELHENTSNAPDVTWK
jgi:hypothetical protein